MEVAGTLVRSRSFAEIREVTDPRGWGRDGDKDRLASVETPVGIDATYGYDTQNLRVRMDDGRGDRRILLDGIEEAAEYDARGGDRKARYDHDPTRVDALLAQVVAQQKLEAAGDALGTVFAIHDSAGAEVAKYSYDAYGARMATLETEGTAWGFTGRRHDADSSRLQFRMRAFDSATGQFIAPDPFYASALLGDVPLPEPHLVGNAYSYAGARVTVLGDPLGLFPRIIPWGGESRACVNATSYAYFDAVDYVQKLRFVRHTNSAKQCPCSAGWSNGDVERLVQYLNDDLQTIVCTANPIMVTVGSPTGTGTRQQPACGWSPKTTDPTFDKLTGTRFRIVVYAPKDGDYSRCGASGKSGTCAAALVLHESAHQAFGIDDPGPARPGTGDAARLGTAECACGGAL